MIELLAPAKLNLGLELLGRRDDGYHEIRTVMVPVSLVDRLRVAPSSEDRLMTAGIAVATGGNLVTRAADLARVTWTTPPLDVTLTKRIPLAAGLGGGSSDAASTLLAAAHLADHEVAAADLLALAARLGSDVPFFLAGGPALVSGRGDVVTPLGGSVALHAVVVAPAIAIPRKTATLYGSISAGDFSDGSNVASIAAEIAAVAERHDALPNAFRRPLHALVPDLADLARTIQVVSSLPANVSGAGPAHYVLCRDAEHASFVARRLRPAFGCARATVHAVRSVAGLNARGVAA